MKTIKIETEHGFCDAEIVSVVAINLGDRIVELTGKESLSEIADKINS